MPKKLARQAAGLTKARQERGKETKIKYNLIKTSEDIINERLDKAFDALFSEVIFTKV